MNIKQLNIENVRLYSSADLSLHPSTNIFLGDNAQGKTTIIESIYILGLTKSHKTNRDRDVIQTNKDYAKINALINLNKKDTQLDIILSKQGKKAKYSQIEMERLSEYIGILNVVMFAPEDMDLIKGNPQNRRKFLDLEIGQISKEYLHNIQQYKKLLKQRNDLLKSMQKDNNQELMLLDIITEQLVDYMTPIIKIRSQFISELNQIASSIYKDLSHSEEVFELRYIPNLKDKILQELSAKYSYDIITGTTNNGCHRDDIEFYINEYPIKTHGSQGEMRTAVLATKLALVEFIYKHKQEYPILLLDDVLSELDQNRQQNLLKYVSNKTQTCITTTNIKDINLNHIQDYKIFHVTNGIIKESE
jgi:DNA replication and repair protein RecF